MPAADHPLWKLLTVAVAGTVLVLMLKFNYANGWAPADYITLATVLLGIGGAQVMPSIFGGRKS